MIWVFVAYLVGVAVVEALNVRALVRSFAHGVAVVRGGSVTRAESPKMFKVYVATQIATVIFLAAMFVFGIVAYFHIAADLRN